jgi:alpha-ketoglutarate-dependent taurine dioxygenase
LITHNHDCIARMHWTKGAAAIWNNSCVWHAATVSLSRKIVGLFGKGRS